MSGGELVDKAALFTPRLPTEDVEVPGFGVVRVRALNRAEAMAVQSVTGIEARERKMLAFGLVEPAFTESEVGQWQRAAPANELEAVTVVVGRLSGMYEKAEKEVVKKFRR